jgi:hypothetical protein
MPPRKSKFSDKKQLILQNTDDNNNNNNNNNNIELLVTTVESSQNDENNNQIFTNQTNYIKGSGTLSSGTDLVTPEQFQKGHVNKKRGRKPKGGKIMTNISSSNTNITEIPNIILHLKCNMNDLKTNNDSISNYDYCPSIEEVQSYIPSSQIIQCSDIVNNDDSNIDNHDDSNNIASNTVGKTVSNTVCNNTASMCNGNGNDDLNNKKQDLINNITSPGNNSQSGNININACIPTTPPLLHEIKQVKTHNVNDKISKDIMKKIHKLKLSFHNSEPVQTKGSNRSACFWDTCDFDTQIFFIPTSIINDTFQVYGCFCSPECAIAYLLKEHIDTSTKFERLHLIQLLYGGIYQYGKGLKPAPSPHFLLDKYFGNLSIQEYRQLLKGTQMIYVVNKPLTHILPELYEDNNDFLVNSKVIPTNNMKLKKRYKTMIIQNQE